MCNELIFFQVIFCGNTHQTDDEVPDADIDLGLSPIRLQALNLANVQTACHKVYILTAINKTHLFRRSG